MPPPPRMPKPNPIINYLKKCTYLKNDSEFEKNSSRIITHRTLINIHASLFIRKILGFRAKIRKLI